MSVLAGGSWTVLEYRRRADLERHRRGGLLGRSGRQRLDRHQRRTGALPAPDRRLAGTAVCRSGDYQAGDRTRSRGLARAEFSSLNYKSEQLVRFAYRLDGEHWTDTAERIVSFAGLGSGPAPAGDPVAGSRWTVLGESGCGGVPDGAEVVGNLVVAVGRRCCLAPPPCGALFCGGTGCCGAGTASWKTRCASGRPNWNRNAPRCWKRSGAPTRPAKPRAASWRP